MPRKIVKKEPGEPTPAVVNPGPAPVIDYGWASNVIKLNRAIGHVQQSKRGLKGAELEAAVKERYLEIGGLVSDGSKVPASKKKRSSVTNLAPHDGTPDDEDDEDDGD